MILVLVSCKSCDNDPVGFCGVGEGAFGTGHLNVYACVFLHGLFIYLFIYFLWVLHGIRATSWVLFVFWVLELFFSISIFTRKVSSFWLSNPMYSLGENKNWFQRRCKILTKRNNANNTKIFTFKKENFSRFGWQFFIFGIWQFFHQIYMDE